MHERGAEHQRQEGGTRGRPGGESGGVEARLKSKRHQSKVYIREESVMPPCTGHELSPTAPLSERESGAERCSRTKICCSPAFHSAIMTGSYNNFFRMFDRNTRRDITLEASRESSKPRAILKPRKVCTGGKRKKDEISVDSLDFNKKILHTAWHPVENIIAVAATNNLYIFQDKIN